MDIAKRAAGHSYPKLEPSKGNGVTEAEMAEEIFFCLFASLRLEVVVADFPLWKKSSAARAELGTLRDVGGVRDGTSSAGDARPT